METDLVISVWGPTPHVKDTGSGEKRERADGNRYENHWVEGGWVGIPVP